MSIRGKARARFTLVLLSLCFASFPFALVDGVSSHAQGRGKRKASATAEQHIDAGGVTSNRDYGFKYDVVQAHLDRLLDGKLEQSKEKGKALAEYVLPAGSGHAHFFSPKELQSKLAGLHVAFVGDSRVRYLFAQFIEAVNGTNADPTTPKHRTCGANLNYDECARHLRGDYNVETKDLYLKRDIPYRKDVSLVGGISASFLLKTSSDKQASALRNLASSSMRKPNIVVLNGGAWDVQFDLVGQLKPGEQRKVDAEDEEKRKEEYKKVIASLDIYDAQLPRDSMKIWMGYPVCDKTHRWRGKVAQELNELLRAPVEKRGWVFFDPSKLTPHWAKSLTVTSRELLPSKSQNAASLRGSMNLMKTSPISTGSEAAKTSADQHGYDAGSLEAQMALGHDSKAAGQKLRLPSVHMECESYHTHNTLTDLEMQIFYNALLNT